VYDIDASAAAAPTAAAVRQTPSPSSAATGLLGRFGRVVILRLDNAGDVILAGPTVRALRAALPGAHLILVASPAGAAAAELLPWLDEDVTWRAVWQDASGEMPFDPGRESAAIEGLRVLGADVAIILTSFSQTPYAAAYACYLAAIPIRVGHAGLFGGSVLSHPVPGPAPVHQAERDLHLLRGLGIGVRDEGLEARVPPEARRTAAGLLGDLSADGPEPIVMSPGASCSARRYAPRAFARVADELGRRTGRPIVVVGTADERPLAAPIVAAVPGALDLVGRTSLVEAAAVVEAAALVVTNNTLAMHLADALRRPVVVTYSGTDLEDEWRPRDTRHVLLRVPTDCSPCRLFDCPFDGHPCLAIDTSAVVEAGLGLLS
jgi:ADP-heptose:LPS heptosyltransferase